MLGALTDATPGTAEYVQDTPVGNWSTQTVVDGIFGAWRHIAVTSSGTGTVELYVNGNLQETTTGAPVPLTNNEALLLGARAVGRPDADFHHGLIDEVRIWNVARTSQEIADDFGVMLDPATPGLVAYWSFDEVLDEQNVFDLSGGHHGVLGATDAVDSDDPVRVPSTAPVIRR